MLELFHGPTFAFKDVALQELGNLFEYFIAKKTGADKRLTIMGATSGDTGSAAIYGLRGKANVDCFILYPEGRVSLIQEQQMATVPDANIHCLKIDGTFDDAQDIVKGAFMDTKFRNRVKLGAVNSINWARVLAQITYYFSAYYQVTEDDSAPVNFSVPTGNFGDILAGYYAKMMGLPVGKLVIATNTNDILHRFMTTGDYVKESIAKSMSPSMDICVSSNFERFLFHMMDDNSSVLKTLMESFEGKATTTANLPGVGSAVKGALHVEGKPLAMAREHMQSARAGNAECQKVIRDYLEEFGYLLCPHSACGVYASIELGYQKDSTMVNLATAHPGKFYDSVSEAVGPAQQLPPLPKELDCLASLPMVSTAVANDLRVCQDLVLDRTENQKDEKKKVTAAPAAIRELPTSNTNLNTHIWLGLAASVVAVSVGMYFAFTNRNRLR